MFTSDLWKVVSQEIAYLREAGELYVLVNAVLSPVLD